MFNNLLSTFLSRVLAAWLAGGAAWLLVRYDILVDTETQKQLVEHLVGVILPVVLTLYAVAHKLVSKKTNPGDTASSHLSEKLSTEAERLKALDTLHK